MSAASALPFASLPLPAVAAARTRPERLPAVRRAARADAHAAEQVRACVVGVMLAGAVVTVLMTIVVVFVPALWSLALLAALHTPVFALMAGHKLTRRLASTQD